MKAPQIAGQCVKMIAWLVHFNGIRRCVQPGQNQPDSRNLCLQQL